MRVTARTQSIGVALYSLPFLAVIIFSLLFTWAGNVEMIVAGVALLPAVLYFFRVRWSRYVVGVFAAVGFLTCSMIPVARGTAGRYFWLIWSPIWLLFAFSCFVSFVPVRQTPRNAWLRDPTRRRKCSRLEVGDAVPTGRKKPAERPHQTPLTLSHFDP